ncbi:MAG: hypothetical protein Q8J78_07845 [Moraxellaceae bacterium]|nr:hypothetical protein [Moraxellaceae bacterium]
MQKGIRERMLCCECETRISKWERYASLAMKEQLPLEAKRIGKVVSIRGVDYKNFKLFQLSILWRSSVAKHEMFAAVSLGQHEEKIRRLLLESDPGNPEDYACLMYALLDGDTPVTDLIDQPMRVRLDRHNAYRFVFGGIVWTYIVTSHNINPVLVMAAINHQRMCILQKDIRQIPELASFANDLKKTGK